MIFASLFPLAALLSPALLVESAAFGTQNARQDTNAEQLSRRLRPLKLKRLYGSRTGSELFSPHLLRSLCNEAFVAVAARSGPSAFPTVNQIQMLSHPVQHQEQRAFLWFKNPA